MTTTKIRLGQRPVHVHGTARFVLPDGSDGAIRMRYLYRTRTEYGALLDEHLAGVQASARAQAEASAALAAQAAAQADADADAEAPAAPADPAAPGTAMRAIFAGQAEANASFILRIADGWDLDEPFTRAAVQQLADELPGAALEIIERYRLACTEGRLGN